MPVAPLTAWLGARPRTFTFLVNCLPLSRDPALVRNLAKMTAPKMKADEL